MNFAEIDRKLLNRLQRNIPISETPFKDLAVELSMDELLLRNKINEYLSDKTLTRFGPFFNMDNSSGAVTLAALSVPESRFEEVANIVNGFEEVAHNYAREHKYNMWFVIASTEKEGILEVIKKIEIATDLKVLNLPKLKEFALDLFLEV